MKHKKGLFDHDKYVTMKMERRFSFREVTQARTYVIKTVTQKGRAGGSYRVLDLVLYMGNISLANVSIEETDFSTKIVQVLCLFPV